MNLLVAGLIVLGGAVVAGLALALVHHVAKKSLLADSGRGRPMIQVTGTMFAVVLAFVILAAFQTYNGARGGAQSEAAAVLDMSRAAALYPPGQRDQLRSDFVCYGRAVAEQEWPAMAHGHSSPLVDRWINSYRAVFARLDLSSPRQQLTFQELLNQAATRTAGRQQRLAEDTGSVPTPLWLALVFAGCVAIALQLSMADPREKVGIQSVLVAGFAGVVVAGLLIVNFLDHPYQRHTGGIQPTAMRQTLVMIRTLQPGLRVGCSPSGEPL